MATTGLDANHDWDDVARRLWPLRQWLARHPRLTTWPVAAACGVLQGILALANGHPFGVALAGISATPLLWRRRYPLWVLVATVLTSSVPLVLLGQNYPSIAFAFALYTLASLEGPRRALLGYAIGVLAPLGVAFATYLNLAERGSPTILDLPALFCLGIGLAVRSHRQRSALLAIIWAERAEHAKVAERARIASDMHDVLAHSLSTIIALASGAASAWDKYPQRSAEALRKISEVGRSALADMNRTLHLMPADLQGTGIGTEPGTSPQSLDSLIEASRCARLPVRLSRHGTLPPDDPELQMTIFRIVQEGLTNALRYANQASRIDVEIATDHEQIDIRIIDDAPASPKRSMGTGRGLYGIAERAARYHGSSSAGPRPSGGWCTQATLRIPAPLEEERP